MFFAYFDTTPALVGDSVRPIPGPEPPPETQISPLCLLPAPLPDHIDVSVLDQRDVIWIAVPWYLRAAQRSWGFG